MNIVSGVYVITNTVTGHRYIGSAVDLRHRWSRHKYELNAGKHYNPHLQRAWDKYGANCFMFSILEYCNILQLLFREQFYLDTLHPEYNIAKYADAPTRGKSLTDEQKEKHRKFRHTEEAKKKISVAKKGHVKSAEWREHLSAARIGIPNATKGKSHSKEWNKKVGDAQRGKKRNPHSEETRQRMSEARKRWWTKKNAK